MSQVSDAVDRILGVTITHESGGNWGAVNKRTGAYGAFQIMPSNWAPWAKEAGLSPHAPRTRQNQYIVARHKFTEYVSKYGVKGAFAAWYGGPTNGYRYSHGYTTDAKGRPWTAKNGNGDEESIQSYVSTQWANYQRNGGVATGGYLNGLGAADLDNYGNDRSQMQKVFTTDDIPKERSWWDRLSDNYWEHSLNQGIDSTARHIWSWAATLSRGNAVGIPGFSKKYQPTQQDIDYVQKLLPGDTEAQNYVLNSAYSVDHMYMLAAMKKEDYDREQRIAQDASFFEGDIAGGLGALAGDIFDPATIAAIAATGGLDAPEVLEAKGAMTGLNALAKLKTIGRLGTTFYKLSPFAEGTLSRVAFSAVKGATAMGFDRYLAQQFGGFKPNYATNMMMGAALGSAGDAFKWAKHITGKSYAETSVGKAVVPKLLKIENGVLSTALDKRPDTLTTQHFTLPKRMHLDVNRLAKKDPEIHVKLNELKDVKFVSHREAKKIASQESVPFTDKTKVFMVPKTGEVVAVGDKIRSPKALDKIVNSVRIMKDEGLNSVVAEGRSNELVATLRDDHGFAEHEAREIADNMKAVTEMKKAPLVTYPDGTARIHGVDFAPDNPLNPLTEANWLQDRSTVEKEMQGDLPKWFSKKLGTHLETSPFFRTIYGELGNSRVAKVRELGSRLFADPRQRGKLHEYGDGQILPAENIATNIRRELETKFDPYYDLRAEWLHKKGHTSQFGRQSSKYFDKQVVDCYNMKYGNQRSKLGRKFDPEVEKAAKVMKDTFDAALMYGKEVSRMHGGGLEFGSLFDKEWNPVDGEFARRVDTDALCGVLNRYFGNDRDYAVKELTKYGIATCDADKLLAKEQQTLDLKYARDMRAFKEHKIGVEPQKPEKLTLADVEKMIPQKAHEWAMGMIDRNQSRVVFGGKDGLGADPVTFLRNRFPMDTGMTMQLRGKDGNAFDFNFDEMVRDTDVDRIMNSYIKRLSGEIAVHDVLGGNWREASQLLSDAHTGLNKVADTIGSGMSRSDAQSQKDTIREGLSRILGTNYDDDTPRGIWDALSNLARTKTYSDVGAQMWLNQLGEFGQAMAYAGHKVLFKTIPILKDARRAVLSKHSREEEDIAHMIRDHMFGQDIARRVWTRTSSTESRSFRDAMAKSSTMAKVLDFGQDTYNFFSKVTSTLNQLPHLTDCMVRQGQEAGILDSLRWAKGEGTGFRKPFSDRALKAVGVVTKEDKEALQKSISKYLNLKDFDTWREKDTTNYFRWRQLVDNYSLKTIQQMGVGDTPLLKEKNWFTKLMFQFKDYTFRAVNSQTMRALTTHQMDDFLAAGYSMASNTLAYVAQIHLRAWAKYPNDPEKRQAYLDRQLSTGMLVWAAISRGAILGSLPSFGSDMYEAWSGKQMMRTTVNHKSDNNNGMAPSDVMGRVVEEMPAVSNAVDPIYYGLSGAYHGMTSQLTKEDARGLMKLLPLNGWLGFTLASSGITDDLPTNKEVRQQERAEEEMNEPTSEISEDNKPDDNDAGDNQVSGVSDADSSVLSKIMNVR